MATVFMHKRNIWMVLVAILSLFIYNEFLVYYFVLLQCHWPQLRQTKLTHTSTPTTGVPLKAMFMADTHLLGSRKDIGLTGYAGMPCVFVVVANKFDRVMTLSQ